MAHGSRRPREAGGGAPCHVSELSDVPHRRPAPHVLPSTGTICLEVLRGSERLPAGLDGSFRDGIGPGDQAMCEMPAGSPRDNDRPRSHDLPVPSVPRHDSGLGVVRGDPESLPDGWLQPREGAHSG